MIWAALAVGLVIVIGGVLVLRLHAFVALLLAALVVASLTPAEAIVGASFDRVSATVVGFDGSKALLSPGSGFDDGGGDFYLFSAPDDQEGEIISFRHPTLEGDRFDTKLLPVERRASELLGRRLIPANDYRLLPDSADPPIARVTEGFADTARKIGVLIAMAAIIGVCLLESGAAERIVLAMQSLFGERLTAVALVFASFVLAIPVFFDTVFFLMLPIAQALAQKRGGDYLKFVLAIVVGGTLAHSLVPPTPGPLFVASELGVPMLDMMLGGIGVGIWGVAAGYAYLVWANRRFDIPVRIESPQRVDATDPLADRLRSDAALPPLWLALLPIVLPIVFLASGTILDNAGIRFSPAFGVMPPKWYLVLAFVVDIVSDKNIALMIAAGVALLTLVLRPGRKRDDGTKAVGKALADGGAVILITCAGGAFGHVIRQTNIAGELASAFPGSLGGLTLLVAAFVLTAVIRVAQGSATVAMITTVGIVAPLASSLTLPYAPVYLALAIGCGSKPLPWMNDSGFWTISKMSGLTEGETLRTFSVLLTIMGLVAFAATLLAATLLPLV